MQTAPEHSARLMCFSSLIRPKAHQKIKGPTQAALPQRRTRGAASNAGRYGRTRGAARPSLSRGALVACLHASVAPERKFHRRRMTRGLRWGCHCPARPPMSH
jgi:hypothetical protein